MLLNKNISVLYLWILPRYQRDKVDHFYPNFCIINWVKTAIFVFPHFLEHYRFLKVKNIFFEDSSPKGFFWQIIRMFDFFSLASDSRYLQSWALKGPAVPLYVIEKVNAEVLLLNRSSLATFGSRKARSNFSMLPYLDVFSFFCVFWKRN